MPLTLLKARVAEIACRWSAARCGLAIVYHRVGEPPGDPETELVPALSSTLFVEQVHHLRARYRVVSASALPGCVAARRRGQRFPVAITFDDDLRCHRDIAMPVLRAAGVPATFFLTGATLRGAQRFWWERLQHAVDAGLPLDQAELQAAAGASNNIHAAASRIQSMSPADRDAVTAALGRCCGPDPSDGGLRADDVRALAEAGFEIGFHTLRHDALPTLDDAALELAMTAGLAELAAAAGSTPTVIAYPHGQTDDRVPAAARRAGYSSGYTTSGAVVRPGDDPYLIGRQLPDTSLASFQVGLVMRLARACWPRLDKRARKLRW